MSKWETKNRTIRLKILLELIQKEFPNHEITTDKIIENEISVTRPKSMTKKKRNHRISFTIDNDLLTDENNEFSEIFDKGIRLAKRYFDNPPFEDKIHQGNVIMNNDSVIFEPRKE